MERFLGNSHSGGGRLPTAFLPSHLPITEGLRPRPVFVGKALPQWRDDALFLRAAVKFQPRSWIFPNLPSPFDLQLFPQDLFDTAWFRGKRLPAGPWPKGSVLPLHPPKAAQGQFWAACPKDPVHYMQAINGVQHHPTCTTPNLSLSALRLKSLLQIEPFWQSEALLEIREPRTFSPGAAQGNSRRRLDAERKAAGPRWRRRSRDRPRSRPRLRDGGAGRGAGRADGDGDTGDGGAGGARLLCGHPMQPLPRRAGRRSIRPLPSWSTFRALEQAYQHIKETIAARRQAAAVLSCCTEGPELAHGAGLHCLGGLCQVPLRYATPLTFPRTLRSTARPPGQQPARLPATSGAATCHLTWRRQLARQHNPAEGAGATYSGSASSFEPAEKKLHHCHGTGQCLPLL